MVNRATLFRLVRSGAAGILATATDLGTLSLLVSFFGVSKLVSNVALTLGSIVMFLCNKYFVFEARAASTLWRESALYAAIQIVGIVLSTYLFTGAVALSPLFAHHYVLVRMVVNNLVWLFYFFPLWHFVFKVPPKAPIL